MAEVVLDRIEKVYDNGFKAVQDLSLSIEDAEFLVLVGPSGCGKSTALRMVAGLEDISAGELRIDGQRMNETASRDRDIAMVFQSYALYPHMSVYENIAFGLKLRKMDKAEIEKRVKQASTMLGLDELLSRKPKQLSGGQRQRVAMGRAIVREPKAFLMDEPLSNLDAKLRVQMRAEIATLQHEMAVTTIYVTHDQVEAMTMGDRVAVMKRGLLQQVAPPQELYDNPVNLFVAGFMGSPPMNVVGATVHRAGDGLDLELGGQRLRLAPSVLAERPGLLAYDGKQIAAGVRSEDIKDLVENPDWPADQRIGAVVYLVEALGSEYVVHFTVQAPKVNTEDGAVAEEVGTNFVASFSPRTKVNVADQISVGVDTARLHFFDLETGLGIG
jgi:multiple sugar transport system ATP-binding protein